MFLAFLFSNSLPLCVSLLYPKWSSPGFEWVSGSKAEGDDIILALDVDKGVIYSLGTRSAALILKDLCPDIGCLLPLLITSIS